LNSVVGVLDYGCGNLHSVVRACAKFSDKIEIVENFQQNSEFTHIVLPGVGSYSNAMKEIRNRGLDQLIHEKLSIGVPLLGICVGMQVLTTEGRENGFSSGLDLIGGSTEMLSLTKSDKSSRIPNMGWNAVAPEMNGNENHLFKGLENGFDAYFAHSFEVKPNDRGDISAFSEFDGRDLVSAVKRGEVYGVQFHPEKSGESGLRVLKNFLSVNAESG
jgi:glutamine amidotransferase